MSLTSTRCSLLAAALLALPAAARAQYATTNAQVLQGWYFYDPTVQEDTKGGAMSTVTLNHFDSWKYGDNFAFVDLYLGQFRDGTNSHLYSELHPRLFINRLLGTKGNVLGIFRDAGLAGELNIGYGFQAWLAGLGGDFAVPFGTLSLNVYYKYTALQIPALAVRQYNNTWQVSPSWVIPFSIREVPFLFQGFVDVNGVKKVTDDKQGLEVMAQPQLLVDVLGPFGGPKDKILVGIEWYLHYHSDNKNLGAPSNLISAPQVMVQWTLH
jgi:nucleoside-specific outer membrane channel protein Tsx